MCIVRVKAIRGETSGMCPDRVVWLRDLAEESSAAIRDKADLNGICLFPARVMPS